MLDAADSKHTRVCFHTRTFERGQRIVRSPIYVNSGAGSRPAKRNEWFNSVVPHINQLCLSVFHRAGGELISFSLNTNFFSMQKPISIKMALGGSRALRISSDYKSLLRNESHPFLNDTIICFTSTPRVSFLFVLPVSFHRLFFHSSSYRV